MSIESVTQGDCIKDVFFCIYKAYELDRDESNP